MTGAVASGSRFIGTADYSGCRAGDSSGRYRDGRTGLEATVATTFRRLLICAAMVVVLCGPGFADERSGLAATQSQQDETNAHDKFLGQISMSGAADAFHDHVDAFSGYLHINMVDLRLRARVGSTSSFNTITPVTSGTGWRAPHSPKHNPGADPGDQLGGSGWQLHMGKLIRGTGDYRDPWTAVMPDGSTHLLYPSAGDSLPRISRERWALTQGAAGYDLTLTDGTVYTFGAGYQDYWNNTVYQCIQIHKPGVATPITIQYDNCNQGSPTLCTITDTYNRTVTFGYTGGALPDKPRIMSMAVKDDQGNTLRTWSFGYPPTPQTTVSGGTGGWGTRNIYELTSVTPPVRQPVVLCL